MEIKLILTTCSGFEEAESLAKELVHKKLAACINILREIHSVYSWNNKIQSETEAMLIIKTSDEKCPELIKSLKNLHSYDTPEIIVLDPESVDEKYKSWIITSLTACD